ncbi:hypothetical protein BD413DRAFT_122118 [Trametes elegans]|nr:hypothetical protein BD413DRAFT_122118 [Trametes elegans]
MVRFRALTRFRFPHAMRSVRRRVQLDVVMRPTITPLKHTYAGLITFSVGPFALLDRLRVGTCSGCRCSVPMQWESPPTHAGFLLQADRRDLSLFAAVLPCGAHSRFCRYRRLDLSRLYPFSRAMFLLKSVRHLHWKRRATMKTQHRPSRTTTQPPKFDWIPCN